MFSGRRVLVDLSDEVIFGDYCTLGNDTSFVSHTDFAHSPLKDELFPVTIGPVRIGRGAFIGSGTMVTSGVTIGQCAIIGANSVVMRDIPPYTLAAGSPAKVIRELDRSRVPPFNETTLIIPEGTLEPTQVFTKKLASLGRNLVERQRRDRMEALRRSAPATKAFFLHQ
jgi:serine acetyltransferase